jgi:hypothetical protein
MLPGGRVDAASCKALKPPDEAVSPLRAESSGHFPTVQRPIAVLVGLAHAPQLFHQWPPAQGGSIHPSSCPSANRASSVSDLSAASTLAWSLLVPHRMVGSAWASRTGRTATLVAVAGCPLAPCCLQAGANRHSLSLLHRTCHLPSAPAPGIDGGRQPRPCRRPYRLPPRASLRGQCRSHQLLDRPQASAGLGTQPQHHAELVIVDIVVVSSSSCGSIRLDVRATNVLLHDATSPVCRESQRQNNRTTMGSCNVIRPREALTLLKPPTHRRGPTATRFCTPS